MLRGEIYYVNFGVHNSSVQNGIRPGIILSNNLGNKYAPVVIVSPLTTKTKTELPTHVEITKNEENGLNLNSIVLLEQLMTVSKSDLRNKIGKVCQRDLNKIEKGLEISLDLKRKCLTNK